MNLFNLWQKNLSTLLMTAIKNNQHKLHCSISNAICADCL
ncbi:hypothetical protein FEM08_18410 [Flavobacterium gilvum]|nr:hypothetical protein FEM08_18410 [Flavobacterium gilvum]